jgi:hypothetical protein
MRKIGSERRIGWGIFPGPRGPNKQFYHGSQDGRKSYIPLRIIKVVATENTKAVTGMVISLAKYASAMAGVAMMSSSILPMTCHFDGRPLRRTPFRK